MENRCKTLKPHPQLLDLLFAFKGSVSQVFKEVIGVHDIAHFALARVNQNNELITLSSTPAMEFNLFNRGLWRYDRNYDPQWFKQGGQASWQQLYHPQRYDELYYLKQIKHGYATGMSFAQKLGESHLIYSIASQQSCAKTQEFFMTEQDEIFRMGQHCANQFTPIFAECDALNEYALSA